MGAKGTTKKDSEDGKSSLSEKRLRSYLIAKYKNFYMEKIPDSRSISTLMKKV